MIDAASPSDIDLGGRVVRVIPRAGHTASDCSLELDDPSIVFCGDLLWNGMFPNYVDATPSELARSVKALRRLRATTYVPGHGAIARQADFDRYGSMLGEIERAARSAHAKGQTAAEAGAADALPAAVGGRVLFTKAFFVRRVLGVDNGLVY